MKPARLGSLALGLGLAVAQVAWGQTVPASPPSPSAPTAEDPPTKETWKGPFGGTFTATFAFATDYSYRGISQTQRQVAFQPSLTYETAPVSEKVNLTAYVGAWGSNVNFPGTGAAAEIDLIAGFRYKALDDKLTFDLGYIRYNYPGADISYSLDFNEYGLVAGYDFGFAQLSGAVRYSPNFYANSGVAWYKWGQLSVPLNFIKINENVSMKLFGTIGNQYVQRFANYGIGYNNYWDWQVGLGVTVYGVDLSIAYVDTNLSVPNCGNTMNCDARAIFMISKTF
ncbi:MAG: TorF family putative porin [Reyranellaceae bacterium]